MNLNDYQQKALETAIYPEGTQKGLEYTILGLASEAGEVAGKYAKWIRDGGEYPMDDIAKELGDVLWMLACCAWEHGYSLEEVAQMNLDKLSSRKERGVLQGSGDDR